VNHIVHVRLNMLLVILVLLMSLGAPTLALMSAEDWINVDQTDIWKDLPTCAQPCVRNVNLNISIQNTHCQSYGCVCAENTQGKNFLDGLSNVTACVNAYCASEQERTAGITAFQDLCLMYSANSSRPYVTPGQFWPPIMVRILSS
jgi:hypothetical protein